MTGLVAGSVIPDFEYFIRMKDYSRYSHTIRGIFWFDLPLGLLLAFIFHNIIRNSLTNNLPLVLRSRLSSFNQFDWNKNFQRNWLVIIISIIIGAASHLLWDGFTHANHFFINSFPSLKTKYEIADRHVHLYYILQIASSIVGGLVVVFALLQLKADKNVKGHISFKYWAIALFITLIIIAIKFSDGFNLRMYKQLIITSISAILIALILTPFLSGSLVVQQRKET